MGWITPNPVGRLTAAKLEQISDEIGGWFARKTADESVTSSSAMQDDNELFVPVVATAVYDVTGLIIYNAAATPQIKVGWSAPSGATLSWNPDALDSSVTAAFSGNINRAWYNIGSTPTLGCDGTGQNVVAKPMGLLIVGANAGNLQFRWAQATSNATATTVKADSFLALVRVA